MPKASPTPVTAPAAVPESYEAALQELEQLVSEMESGQMPLDSLLAAYRRGATLLEHCRSQLLAVEEQIKVLDGAQAKPWGEA